MRPDKIVGPIAAVFLLCMLSVIAMPAHGADVIKVGEPLHLHLRRLPVQDMTYLFFHPPDSTYENIAKDDLSYRKTFLAKGTGRDFEVIYFPQDPQSNFLQFEPNSSIPLTYSFNISGVKPMDLTDIAYILNIKIDIDYNHDGSYDDVISFDIKGETKSHMESKKGTVPINMNDLKKFNAKDGGRLRINISRQDHVDTSLTVYCGYHGYNSYLELPFSKYKYIDPVDPPPPVIWPWVLGIGALMILAAVGFFYFKQKQVENNTPEPVVRKGARRKR